MGEGGRAIGDHFCFAALRSQRILTNRTPWRRRGLSGSGAGTWRRDDSNGLMTRARLAAATNGRACWGRAGVLGRRAQSLAGSAAPRLWRIFGWFDSSILRRRGSGGLARSKGPKPAAADSEKPAARGSAAAAPPAGRSGGVGRRARGEGGPGPRLLDSVVPRQRTCLGLSGQCGVPGPGRAGLAGVSGHRAGPRAWSRAPHCHARPSLGARAPLRVGCSGPRGLAGARPCALPPPLRAPGRLRGRSDLRPGLARARAARDLVGRTLEPDPSLPPSRGHPRGIPPPPTPEACGQPSVWASGFPVPRRPAPPPSSGSRQAPPPSPAWAGPMLSFPLGAKVSFDTEPRKTRASASPHLGVLNELTPFSLSFVCKCPSSRYVRVNRATQIPCGSRSPSPSYTPRILV